MEIFKTVCDGFLKVFTGKDVAVKHVCLFALTGIISYSTTQSEIFQNQVSENMTSAITTMPNFTGLILGGLAALIVGCYLFGYNLSFMRNIHYENPEGYLPEFDENPFKIFFKSFPLLMAWIGYFILMMIVISISFALIITIPVGILGILAMVLIAALLQFVWIKFSKDYDSTGLFNIKTPFKYLNAILPMFLIGLFFIPAYLLIMIACVIIGVIFGFLGASETLVMYTGGIIAGYLGYICQLVWYYCLIKLYKEKYEDCAE